VQPARAAAVQRRLLDWYAQHGRDLPWRKTRDPYAVLVSEVMLQQTQVDRVIPRWHAWLEQFPTLRALAAASRADAIRAWQGLGYNLRAVRLHGIATQCVAEFDGQLPGSVAELLRLDGIGPYTAGAVACFAFGRPVAMVDTNVKRVLTRVFVGSATLRTTELQRLADQLVPATSAYAWSQALMDLGATLCRAQAPLCLLCPLVHDCTSAGQVERRPAKVPSQGPFAGSTRYLRGRILDALRTLPTDASLSFDELTRRFGDQERLKLVVDRLTTEGLVARTAEDALTLPD
jgi:A/G-specific adenine glycosylase